MEKYTKIILAIFFVFYVAYFCAASFLRYTNFYTGRFDLGNMDQTVWNTSQGRIFQLTNPDSTNIISRLSIHADFLLILLAPFYYIWQDPRMLLLIQTIVLAIGGIYVYAIAKKITQQHVLSLAFSFVYFLSPSVTYTNLYDFHAVTLATTFLLAMWYYFLQKKWKTMGTFLLLACITKEQIWIMAILLGIYLFFTTSKKMLGLFVTSFSAVAFCIIFFYAIPHARGAAHFALSYYSDFGSSPASILKGIVFSPIKTITTLLTLDRLLFLHQILFSVGYLSLLSPAALLFALPDVAINLLSNNAQLHQIYYQYTAIITPFVFVTAISACVKIKKLFPKVRYSYLTIYLIATALLNAYFCGPLPFTKNPSVNMFIKPLQNADAIDVFLQKIPRRYSIAVTNNIGSHLSHRQKIYALPNGIDSADVLIFLLTDTNAQPSLAQQESWVRQIQHDPHYLLLNTQGPFIVFAKKGSVFSYPFKKTRQVQFRQTFPLLYQIRQLTHS